MKTPYVKNMTSCRNVSIGFTHAIEQVEDSTRHGEVIAMGEQLRRVQYAYKCLREKAEVADPKILTALGRVLAHFLERIDDESLCRDACSFVSSLARGCAYRGADWAVSLMPYLLTCLEQEHSTINTTAYQSLVAMVSHCYDAKGRLLASIIVIEKWPPSSVQAHMPALCEVSEQACQVLDISKSSATYSAPLA